MGYSRQDYGDYGAASLGNSCYKTHRERATLSGRWEEIKKRTKYSLVLTEIKSQPNTRRFTPGNLHL